MLSPSSDLTTFHHSRGPRREFSDLCDIIRKSNSFQHAAVPVVGQWVAHMQTASTTLDFWRSTIYKYCRSDLVPLRGSRATFSTLARYVIRRASDNLPNLASVLAGRLVVLRQQEGEHCPWIRGQRRMEQEDQGAGKTKKKLGNYRCTPSSSDQQRRISVQE